MKYQLQLETGNTGDFAAYEQKAANRHKMRMRVGYTIVGLSPVSYTSALRRLHERYQSGRINNCSIGPTNWMS